MKKTKNAVVSIMLALLLAVMSVGCGAGGTTKKNSDSNVNDTHSVSNNNATEDEPVSSNDNKADSKSDSNSLAVSSVENKSQKKIAVPDNNDTDSTADKNVMFADGEGAKLYSGEGGTGDVIGIVPQNDNLTILEKSAGGYWKVKTSDGTVGYLAMENISETKTDGLPVDITDTGSNDQNDNSNNSKTQNPKNDDQTGKGSSDYADSFEAAVANAQSNTGGNWAACLQVLDGSEPSMVNDSQMQAASLIKLYIMGAIYENYDEYSSENGNIDSLIHDMITVSDNTAANTLVGILGNGDTTAGRGVVTAYCQKNGYKYTSMGRLLLESTINGDNYTSVGDCTRFLTAVYNSELPHSNDMLKYLKNQERTSKIPAGVPNGVQTANKTGELDSVQNDAAIVFADKPYVLCVMSENVAPGTAVSSIVTLSSDTYNMVNK